MTQPPPPAFPASPQPPVVVPAQLGFVAIFNPSLGATDETIDDQIVYYASVASQNRSQARQRIQKGGSRTRPTEGISQDERNERLRQIGLAQGMVEFGRGFADGKAIDVIETAKARVVLRELEPGWWILASVDLTRLPLPPRFGGSPKDDASENVEYSSREVKPAALLLQDLLRAHSIFLLHHAASLSALFVRSKRSKFVALLGKYWDLFLSTWNVMLHGNPACALFGGIKTAACGELGVGVGEEERGSGEREVLEGFVDRVEGLVDLVVSKFGDADLDPENKSSGPSPKAKWIGTGEEPGAEDGAIFLGVGALSRHSLRDVTCWMEDLYTWGEDAYGVRDSPTSTRSKPKRNRVKSVSDKNDQTKKPAEDSGAGKVDQPKDHTSPPKEDGQVDKNNDTDDSGTNKLMHYLKLGYGTHWSLKGPETLASGPEPSEAKVVEERPQIEPRRSSKQHVDDSAGHYLIGLQGQVDDNSSDSSEADPDEADTRTLLRTVTVELEKEAHNLPEEEKTRDLGSGDHELRATKSRGKDPLNRNTTFDSQDRNKSKKMRVVVYVSKPFIYTFLFQNRTDSLAWDSLYRSLHYQLEPLRKPLSLSTSYRPGKPDAGAAASHIFDLVWDPQSLLIHSTIPSVPDPISALRPDSRQQDTWSRVEAMSTHMQILQTYAGTRDDENELERTCKTSRGWWVVWLRILEPTDTTTSAADESKAPPSLPSGDSQDSEISTSTTDSSESAFPSLASDSSDNVAPSGESGNHSGGTARPDERRQKRRKEKKLKVSKEIFLIRRAGEGASRGRSLSQISQSQEGWADGASRLAQGIGVDTRKYIEGLLSLAQ
ncbi:putative CCZ1/INTU/HSP4 first Longin domain-containing protein [Seiridium unicorne]|uniref:CCZ1/INTU/HSP4 first Longin domain-containing protein n=1 Tax=Seiridium unicorne TaxID=138068 RepID=A0ABR2UM10_9PEZI